jgi:hypothetical protein
MARRAAAAPSAADAALDRVSAINLRFPLAEVKLSHGAPWFHVRGKMFMAFADHHHGDGRLAVWCKATFAEQKRLVASDAERFFVPPYVGVKGWVGVRLDHPRTDWMETAARPAPPLKRPKTDPEVARAALDRLSKIALALPEAHVERSASHATFTVGKKTFAYFLDNHHGDEIVAACLKGSKAENAELVKSEPKRFYLPAYIGPKGWIGVRLDVGRVDWKDVAARTIASYCSVAPKKLAAKVTA